MAGRGAPGNRPDGPAIEQQRAGRAAEGAQPVARAVGAGGPHRRELAARVGARRHGRPRGDPRGAPSRGNQARRSTFGRQE